MLPGRADRGAGADRAAGGRRGGPGAGRCGCAASCRRASCAARGAGGRRPGAGRRGRRRTSRERLGIVKWVPPMPPTMSGEVEPAPDLLPWVDIENIQRLPGHLRARRAGRRDGEAARHGLPADVPRRRRRACTSPRRASARKSPRAEGGSAQPVLACGARPRRRRRRPPGSPSGWARAGSASSARCTARACRTWRTAPTAAARRSVTPCSTCRAEIDGAGPLAGPGRAAGRRTAAGATAVRGPVRPRAGAGAGQRPGDGVRARAASARGRRDPARRPSGTAR